MTDSINTNSDFSLWLNAQGAVDPGQQRHGNGASAYGWFLTDSNSDQTLITAVSSAHDSLSVQDRANRVLEHIGF